MLLEGLKLMILGMATVILFLVFMIILIEMVKYLNLNFNEIEKNYIEKKEKSEFQTSIAHKKKEFPIEVFAAAINAFESDKNRYSNLKHIKT